MAYCMTGTIMVNAEEDNQNELSKTPSHKTLQSYSFGSYTELHQYVWSKWNKQIKQWERERINSSEKGKESRSNGTRVFNWDQSLEVHIYF